MYGKQRAPLSQCCRISSARVCGWRLSFSPQGRDASDKGWGSSFRVRVASFRRNGGVDSFLEKSNSETGVLGLTFVVSATKAVFVFWL